MKKKIFSVFLCVVFVLSMTACGGSKKDGLEGTWKLSKAYFGDKEVSQEQLQSAGIGGTTFAFKDGVVTIETASTKDKEIAEGEYSLNGNTVIISTKDEKGSYEGTLKDGKLTFTESSSAVSEVATATPTATGKAAKKDVKKKATKAPETTQKVEKDAPSSTTGAGSDVEIKLVFEKE